MTNKAADIEKVLLCKLPLPKVGVAPLVYEFLGSHPANPEYGPRCEGAGANPLGRGVWFQPSGHVS